MNVVLATAFAVALVLVCSSASAQELRPRAAEEIQKRAHAAMSLVSFSITPDATAGSLSINSASTGDPDVTLGSAG